MKIIITKNASESILQMFDKAFENNKKEFGNCPPTVITEEGY